MNPNTDNNQERASFIELLSAVISTRDTLLKPFKKKIIVTPYEVLYTFKEMKELRVKRQRNRGIESPEECGIITLDKTEIISYL